MVINNTEGIISEVVIRHEPTGKVGSASMILPQKSFDLGFSQQPLLAKEATVTWINQSGEPKRVEVSLPYESDGDSNILVYIIGPADKVHVTLEKSVVNSY
jgi:hypothetical protein